ncbi:MAG: hypothetical protein U0169_01820 [Polyangiaceae bacterium]
MNGSMGKKRIAGVVVVGGLVAVFGGRQSAVVGLSGCNGTESARACRAMACVDGVDVAFTYRDTGTYVFEVTVDGTKTTCTATLPLVATAKNGCDADGVFLGLVGSELPPRNQSIGGLTLTTTTAKRIAIRGTKDGVVLGDVDVAPPYRTTPEPNGEGCEPKECKLARMTFP